MSNHTPSLASVAQTSRLLQSLQACGASLKPDRIQFADGLEAKHHEAGGCWIFSGKNFFFAVEKTIDKKTLTAKILQVHIELIQQ